MRGVRSTSPEIKQERKQQGKCTDRRSEDSEAKVRSLPPGTRAFTRNWHMEHSTQSGAISVWKEVSTAKPFPAFKLRRFLGRRAGQQAGLVSVQRRVQVCGGRQKGAKVARRATVWQSLPLQPQEEAPVREERMDTEKLEQLEREGETPLLHPSAECRSRKTRGEGSGKSPPSERTAETGDRRFSGKKKVLSARLSA